jgi:F-type H+-transporting ATPase subunit delta
LIRQSIAKRYAKGLFAVGEKGGTYRDFLGELDTILQLFDKEQPLGKALTLPLLEMERRKAILGDVLKALNVSLPLANMLMMLLENNRMSYLHVVREVYSELVDDLEGRVRGTVWSPFLLDDVAKSRIQDVLKERFHKDVVLESVEDKALIGGVKVEVKGTIIDGSVKRQLEILKENILKE